MVGESKKVLFESLTALCSTALGLVGALAWNDAIKEIIKKYAGADEGLGPRLIYAVIATIIAIVVVYSMARITARASRKAANEQYLEK